MCSTALRVCFGLALALSIVHWEGADVLARFDALRTILEHPMSSR